MNPGFKRLLAKVEVLSLDIFDTTLARRCAQPVDVFHELARRAVSRFGDEYGAFTAVRQEAEHRARGVAWETRRAEDTNLAEIYRQIGYLRADWEPMLAHLEAAELELEKSLLYPLPAAAEMIAAARAMGKRVIFISDMYLPKAFCEEVLRDNGFADYDHFFLSSADGLLKNTGNLFKHALEKLGCAASAVLHVGDNPEADGKQARRLGLRTYAVRKAIDCLDGFERNPHAQHLHMSAEQRGWGRSLLTGLSAKYCFTGNGNPRQRGLWVDIGAQFAAPVLYGYVRYLVEQLAGKHCAKIYFLSRDGYILKRIYELITAARDDCPEAVYLQASRRALNFAAITELSERTLPWLMEGVNLTVGQFLQRIGLQPEAFAGAIRGCGFRDSDHRVVEGAEYGMLQQLYYQIAPQLLQAAAREREHYTEYLHSLGVFDQPEVVLVDVGWMTSIQHSLAAMIHARRPAAVVEGYYVGTYAEARFRATATSRHHSWLMHYGEPLATHAILRHCVPLLEFFFASPEHTLLCVQRSDDGALRTVHAPFHENEQDLPALEVLHETALNYTRDMVRVGPDGGPVLPVEAVVNVLERMLCAPTREEARALGRVHYADGYGAFFNHTLMGSCPGIRRLGLSKSAWKSDFKRCHWPKGYVVALGPFERWLFHRMYPNARYVKKIG